MFVFHEPFVLVVVAGRSEFPWDFATVDLLHKLGDQIVLFFGLVDKTGSEFHFNPIEFLGADAASNPISAFNQQMRDVVLCEGLGGTDPRYSSSYDDDFVTVRVHVSKC